MLEKSILFYIFICRRLVGILCALVVFCFISPFGQCSDITPKVSMSGGIAGPWSASFGAQSGLHDSTQSDPGNGLTYDYMFISRADVSGGYNTGAAWRTALVENSLPPSNYASYIDVYSTFCRQAGACGYGTVNAPAQSATHKFSDYNIPEEYYSDVVSSCAMQVVNSGDAYEEDQALIVCTPAVPPSKCTATDTIIDFGNLSPKEFDGARRNATTTVSCTSDAVVDISFLPENIVLSNGGTANLNTVNEQTENVTAGVSAPIEISAALSGNPGLGTFQGSSTIVLTVE